ncbi:MAG TPA: hypothetical protein PKJ41_08685 [Bryobacteraceae bacterium]|nr:hypothetical protein [Bryobacteraceae bacterium]
MEFIRNLRLAGPISKLGSATVPGPHREWTMCEAGEPVYEPLSSVDCAEVAA